jgi:hypothetical protein
VRKRSVVCSFAVVVAACSSPAVPTASPGTGQPAPGEIGSLTIRSDTGVFVVGRQVRFVINAADASGAPVDATNTEITASNPAVAQFAGAIAVPISGPQTPYLNTLIATFTLASAGSTAIRARLGILTDSIVISVIPQM